MDQKSVGPSYMAIAERYTKDSNTIKKLAGKIIQGGSGAWGEHAMSAHPQMTQQQAIEIVGYILSLKDDASIARSVPLKGKIIPRAPAKDKAAGEYILSVSYKDKQQQGAGSNVMKKNFHIRNPRVSAVTSDDNKGVSQAGSIVQFTEPGAWLLFKNIDLTGIKSLTFELDSMQMTGSLSVHLGSPNGRQIGIVMAQQKAASQKSAKLKQKVNAVIEPASGMHDVYIVYHPPGNEKPDTFHTLFLEWITFNRK
jgi:cytochrome c